MTNALTIDEAVALLSEGPNFAQRATDAADRFREVITELEPSAVRQRILMQVSSALDDALEYAKQPAVKGDT